MRHLRWYDALIVAPAPAVMFGFAILTTGAPRPGSPAERKPRVPDATPECDLTGEGLCHFIECSDGKFAVVKAAVGMPVYTDARSPTITSLPPLLHHSYLLWGPKVRGIHVQAPLCSASA